jgi:CDP-paratose 2-epimerase
MIWSYQDQPRAGDHICYYSDLARMRRDYPAWQLTKDVPTTIAEIVEGWQRRLREQAA